MKKKVLAVLLAVCMIAGTCVLFASADDLVTYGKEGNAYGEDLNGKTYTAVKGLSTVTKKEHKIKKVDKPSLPASAQEVTGDNVKNLLTFDPTFNADIFEVESNPWDDSSAYLTVTVTVKDAKQKMYVLKKDLKDETQKDDSKDVTVKPEDYKTEEPWNYITATGADSSSSYVAKFSFKKSDVERTDSLNNMNVGLRFFGEKYDNLVASELAIVKAFIDRDSDNTPPAAPGAGDYTTYANTIYDLSLADTVYLYTKLKDKNEEKFYKFYAWVDANGKILQKAGTPNAEGWYGAKFPADSGSVYAAYVEIVDRVTITYSAEGEGSINMFSDDREIAKLGGNKAGDNMVSVMKGRDVTVTFVPKEGWEVGKVIVDGTNITSFANIDFTSATTLARTIRAIIDATYKDTIGGQQASGSYTFYDIQDPLTGEQSHSIKVVFVKSNPLEAPSGKELPTIEAEGLTLATGAAAENAEGGAAGGAAGEGANGGAAGGTTLPAENGAAAGGSAVSGVVNPATGSTGTIAVFAVLSAAACAAFVTAKKKED